MDRTEMIRRMEILGRMVENIREDIEENVYHCGPLPVWTAQRHMEQARDHIAQAEAEIHRSIRNVRMED